MRDWLDVLDDDGGLTIALTDGRDLMVYADRDLEGTIHVGQLLPPYQRLVLGDEDLVVDLGARGTKSRKGVIVSSRPLDVDPTPLTPWDGKAVAGYPRGLGTVKLASSDRDRGPDRIQSRFPGASGPRMACDRRFRG